MTKIIVKRTSDSSSCEIELIPKIERVSTLLEVVRDKMGIDSSKFLRLISQGKLLEPPEAPIVQFNLQDGSFVHLVVTDNRPTVSAEFGTRQQQRPTERQLSRGGLNELTITHGLDANEVAALRATFGPQIEEFRVERSLERNGAETENEFQTRLEMEYMWAQGRNSEFWRNLPPPTRNTQRALAERVRRFERLAQSDNDDDFDINGEFTSQSFLGSLLGRRPYAPLGQMNDEEEEGGTEMTARGRAGRESDDSDDDSDLEAGRGPTAPRAPGSLAMERDVPVQYQLGTLKDCCWGVLMGSAFGTLMLLCIFDSNRNHRWKVGVLLGVCIQLMMSISEKSALNAEQG
jgi:hypothetical protein